MTPHSASYVRWVAGEWSPCSVTCGSGMQRRNVNCRSLPELEVSESLCPNDTRPVGMRPCNNEQPCATWREGEWGEVCGGRVGRGVWREGECGEVCGGRESGERERRESGERERGGRVGRGVWREGEWGEREEGEWGEREEGGRVGRDT